MHVASLLEKSVISPYRTLYPHHHDVYTLELYTLVLNILDRRVRLAFCHNNLVTSWLIIFIEVLHSLPSYMRQKVIFAKSNNKIIGGEYFNLRSNYENRHHKLDVN